MKEAFFVFFFLPHTTKVLSGLHLFSSLFLLSG